MAMAVADVKMFVESEENENDKKTENMDAILHVGGLEALVSAVEKRRKFPLAKMLSPLEMDTLAERVDDVFDWDTMESVLLPRLLPAIFHILEDPPRDVTVHPGILLIAALTA